MIEPGFYLGDCMDYLKDMPDKSIDLAVCDPPYGINVGKASMGMGGQGSTPKQICAPGGGNKQYIPFGGKRNPKWGGRESEGRNPSERIRVGGVSLSHPKSIRRSMTAAHRAPRILRNCGG